MSTHQIVCLANSYKHEHRCIAGIDLATKRWVRLVGNKVSGCVTIAEASYADGQQVELLDVFEVKLSEPCGTECHPEDVQIAGSCFTYVRKFNRAIDFRLLSSLKAKAGEVLQGSRDRIYAGQTIKKALNKSLDLVHPDDLWWWIRNDGKRKNRALFRSNRTRFDLAVTDPAWLERLAPLEPGIYPHSSFFIEEAPLTFLTISMSEPFERFNYKLVAGVIAAR